MLQYNNILSIHIMLMLLSSKNNFLDTILPEVCSTNRKHDTHFADEKTKAPE